MAFSILTSLTVLFLCADYVHLKSVSHNWDILIFTQSWPNMACEEWTDKDHSHTCSLPKNRDSWSVHGVWPTQLHTRGPAFCNRTWHFDPEEVKTIEQDLMQLWINVEKETSTYALWAHEWNKHGTCATLIEPLNSQLKYFSQGLKWEKKYMMGNILSKANIVPSNTKEYGLTDIYSAIKNTLGVNPVVECSYIHKEGKSYLRDIRICFDKSLNLVDCDGIVYHSKMSNGILSNCNKTEGIVYLRDATFNSPKSIIVQMYKVVSWLQWLTL